MTFPEEFTFLQFFLTIKFKDDIIFPETKGSRLRGVLGRALHDMSCRNYTKCEECSDTLVCPYANLFKPELILKNRLVSPPFVIYSDNTERFIKKGETLEIVLTLFGKFTDYYNYFIEALYKAQEIGLGEKNINFEIIELSVGTRKNLLFCNGVYNPNISINPKSLSEIKKKYPKKLELELISPVQIKKNKQIVFNPSFEDLLNAGKRRINMINKNIWCIDDFSITKEELLDIKNYSIESYKIYYHKIFKDKGMGNMINLSGVTGKIIIKGRELTKFYTFFKALEVLHIGAKASYGLGKIKVRLKD